MGTSARQETGVRWYVGIPGSGKTTLAFRHLAELTERTGWPSLVIDSAGVEQLAGVEHVADVRSVVDAVWGRGAHAAIIPDQLAQVEQLARAARAAGEVNILVDEASFWLSARRGIAGGLVSLMRAHRHARSNLLLTTQHLTGDVPQEALSCAPRLYIFRCTAPAVLERLRAEGVDVESVQTLAPYAFMEHYSGF